MPSETSLHPLIIFCNGKILLHQKEGFHFFPNDESYLTIPEGTNFLSFHNFNTTEITREIEEKSCSWVPLRTASTLLPDEEYKLAVKASEIIHWDKNNRFCGRCGGEMRISTEISRICKNCGFEIWPQLSPAIIVLIKRDERILLVRNKNFKGDFYGLVAGFVEPGETLEETVKREIKEETSLDVDNIKYIGSQSWPFPAQMMIGFTAEYKSGNLLFADHELTEGKFFSRDNLPNIPSPPSIARTLIEKWIEGEI